MKNFLTSADSVCATRCTSTSEAAQPQLLTSALSYVRRAALGAALVGGTLLASPAVAQQQPVAVDKVESTVFRVRTRNLAKQHGQVQVYSLTDGYSLFNEAFDQSYYTCHLNFRDLKPGKYLLILKVGKDSYRYALRVTSNGASEEVAVRNAKIRLGKQSQQVAALNAVRPAATPPALAVGGNGL